MELLREDRDYAGWGEVEIDLRRGQQGLSKGDLAVGDGVCGGRGGRGRSKDRVRRD